MTEVQPDIGPIRLEPGSLVVLCGAAGSGKSTFAAQHFPQAAVLSSDRLRHELLGDAARQDRPELIFGRLNGELRQRLAGGELVVVDTTASRRSARRRMADLARAAGRPSLLVVLDVPLRVCLAQNQRRQRRVPPDRLTIQHQSIAGSIPGGFRDEGFDRVLVLRVHDLPRARFMLPDGPGAPAGSAACQQSEALATGRPAVKVRGIYATALTVVLRELGFPIAEPSPVIQERLGIMPGTEPLVTVRDTRDLQGVTSSGGNAAAAVCYALESRLPAAVVYRTDAGRALELSGASKTYLDDVRASVMPTVPGHHRFKAIDSGRVDCAEQNMAAGAQEVAAQLERELVESGFRQGEVVEVQHVKPWRQRGIVLRGEFEGLEQARLLLRRSFRPGGVYDSLEAPILPGDRGTLEIQAGSWVSRRAYYRADGREIGCLYNIQTPAELYPGRARYVDLEVDVVTRPGEPPRVVDLDDLEQVERAGQIGESLAARARGIADRLAERLAVGDEHWWDGY
ncbi:MAG: AAA family ATPase [Chloroflexi bacterium]|nr:AAA family ATPase [Chloroflexota bacterium]